MTRPLGILAAVLLIPCALHAQTDTTARVVGFARSSFNGHPLTGVMISVPAVRKFAVTDSTGRFALTGLPAGRQRVRISYEGRSTEEDSLELQAGRAMEVTVLLDIEAIDLAPIVVEAQHRDFSRNLAGFYERRKWYGAFAKFYTREHLERTHPVALSQLLTTDGIFTRCDRQGCIPLVRTRGTQCAVSVSVDGMPFWEQDYDQIAIDEVQAVEVYTSAFGAPPSARTTIPVAGPSGSGPNGPMGRPFACASVMIWTR